jgi:hypothetical protein
MSGSSSTCLHLFSSSSPGRCSPNEDREGPRVKLARDATTCAELTVPLLQPPRSEARRGATGTGPAAAHRTTTAAPLGAAHRVVAICPGAKRTRAASVAPLRCSTPGPPPLLPMGRAHRGATDIVPVATRQARGRARQGCPLPLVGPPWVELAGSAGQFGGYEVEARADG